MSYLLDVELMENSTEGRLALYRHALLKEAHTTGKPLLLRAVGSGWDDVGRLPTQQTDITPAAPLRLVEIKPSRLRLFIEDWPEEAPLGELMQFSIGDHGGELYLWTRALGFTRNTTPTHVPLDAEG